MTNEEAKTQLRVDWTACAIGVLKGRTIDWVHHDREFDNLSARTDPDTAYAQISDRFKLISQIVNRGLPL